MFLDDELKAVYDLMTAAGEKPLDILSELLNTCHRRLVKPENVQQREWDREFPTLIKQVDNSFRRFVKVAKPNHITDTTFRKYICLVLKENHGSDLVREWFRVLNWDLPEEWLK